MQIEHGCSAGIFSSVLKGNFSICAARTTNGETKVEQFGTEHQPDKERKRLLVSWLLIAGGDGVRKDVVSVCRDDAPLSGGESKFGEGGVSAMMRKVVRASLDLRG